MFLIKFGKKEYLEQLINGKIYFSNARRFIAMEEEQQKKGQGDAYEGRILLPAFNVEIHDHDTNELITTLTNANLNLVSMPISRVGLLLKSGYGKRLRENC